jgi:DtxR family transcriptional regulator, Mn-dependent transcriptional regulator
METWKQFDANSLTHSAAHHLFAIHELGSRYGGWARVSDIARLLGITRGSVSISLRALKTRGLVTTDEHHMVRLSARGQEVVDNVSAKRAAVRTFLRDVLGLTAEQAEVDSCKIEHLISPQMAQRLVHFMKFLVDKNSGRCDVLRAFRRFQGDCRSNGHCEICPDRCLLAQITETA